MHYKKTIVYKHNAVSGWICFWFHPSTGPAWVAKDTWQEAMDEACRFEKNRAWL